MSELCERCGWPKMVQHAPDWRERCWWNFPAVGDSQTACLLRAHDRERARADRYQAEFSACKALLIAAEGRAEEAEREVQDLLERYQGTAVPTLQAQLAAAEQRASEARALALREAAEVCEDLSASQLGNGYGNFGNAFDECAQAIRALAALPVEPARRQVTEKANALGAPAARSPATPEEER